MTRHYRSKGGVDKTFGIKDEISGLAGETAGLRTELKLLKTYILDYKNYLTDLKRAEDVNGAELDEDAFEDLAPPYEERSRDMNVLRAAPPLVSTSSPSRSLSQKSSSDNADTDDDGNQKSLLRLEGMGIDLTHGDRKRALPNEKSGIGLPPSENQHRLEPSVHRESELLLQLIPYSPRPTDPRKQQLLISGVVDTKSKRPVMQEATESIRLLLDKWTTSGSAPVSDVLSEEAAKDRQAA